MLMGVCYRGLMEVMGGCGERRQKRQIDRHTDLQPDAVPPHPLLALCHAPSSPPELSLACQNQSRDAMLSVSHVPVWTG